MATSVRELVGWTEQRWAAVQEAVDKALARMAKCRQVVPKGAEQIGEKAVVVPNIGAVVPLAYGADTIASPVHVCVDIRLDDQHLADEPAVLHVIQAGASLLGVTDNGEVIQGKPVAAASTAPAGGAAVESPAAPAAAAPAAPVWRTSRQKGRAPARKNRTRSRGCRRRRGDDTDRSRRRHADGTADHGRDRDGSRRAGDGWSFGTLRPAAPQPLGRAPPGAARRWRRSAHPAGRAIDRQQRDRSHERSRRVAGCRSDARSAGRDIQRTQSVRDGLAASRTSLVAERQELIKQEGEFK